MCPNGPANASLLANTWSSYSMTGRGSRATRPGLIMP